LVLISDGPNRGKIMAELIVADDIMIPKGTAAILFSADLLGEMNVKLIYDEKNAKPFMKMAIPSARKLKRACWLN
jgi:hypothetical protein